MLLAFVFNMFPDACYLGVHTEVLNEVDDFNYRVGRSQVVYLYYVLWFKDSNGNHIWDGVSGGDSLNYPENGWGSAIKAIVQKGLIPLIAWHACLDTNATDEPKDVLQKIIDGQFDDYIRATAQFLASIESPIFVRLNSEFNGNWVAYDGYHNGGGTDSNGNGIPDGPERFVEAWRHIRRIFWEVGADNVYFFWHANPVENRSLVPWYDAGLGTWNYINENTYYWPGDAYVDVVSWSLYQRMRLETNWQEFDYLMSYTGGPYDCYSQYIPSKPLALGEWGASDVDYDVATGQTKAGWFSRAFSYLKQTYPKVFAEVYFNIDMSSGPEKEDFRIWAHTDPTAPDSQEAYRNSVFDPSFLALEQKNSFLNWGTKFREIKYFSDYSVTSTSNATVNLVPSSEQLEIEVDPTDPSWDVVVELPLADYPTSPTGVRVTGKLDENGFPLWDWRGMDWVGFWYQIDGDNWTSLSSAKVDVRFEVLEAPISFDTSNAELWGFEANVSSRKEGVASAFIENPLRCNLTLISDGGSSKADHLFYPGAIWKIRFRLFQKGSSLPGKFRFVIKKVMLGDAPLVTGRLFSQNGSFEEGIKVSSDSSSAYTESLGYFTLTFDDYAKGKIQCSLPNGEVFPLEVDVSSGWAFVSKTVPEDPLKPVSIWPGGSFSTSGSFTVKASEDGISVNGSLSSGENFTIMFDLPFSTDFARFYSVLINGDFTANLAFLLEDGRDGEIFSLLNSTSLKAENGVVFNFFVDNCSVLFERNGLFEAGDLKRCGIVFVGPGQVNVKLVDLLCSVYSFAEGYVLSEGFPVKGAVVSSFLDKVETPSSGFYRCALGWDGSPYTVEASASCFASRKVQVFGEGRIPLDISLELLYDCGGIKPSGYVFRIKKGQKISYNPYDPDCYIKFEEPFPFDAVVEVEVNGNSVSVFMRRVSGASIEVFPVRAVLHLPYPSGTYQVVLNGVITETVNSSGYVSFHVASSGAYLLVENYSSQVEVSTQVVSPNGDGINDFVVFKIPGRGILKIYSITGKLLWKEESENFIIWDGKDSKGDLLPRGVYLYVLETPSGTKTGKVVVTR